MQVTFVKVSATCTSFRVIQTLLQAFDFCQGMMFTNTCVFWRFLLVIEHFWLCLSTFSLKCVVPEIMCNHTPTTTPPYSLEKVVLERKYVKVYGHEHMDKIDSILLSWTKFLTQSQERPILQQNYIQMDRDRDIWKLLVNRSNSPSHLQNFLSLSPPPSPPPFLSWILSMVGI